MSVVLMYHSLHKDDDTSLIDTEDLPYAVSESQFIKQMELLADLNVGLCSDTGMPDVVITFDDGHISNHDIALDVLRRFGFSAYFFITSDFIGKRRGFCDPSHIKTLSDAGMVIGSHGQTHRFFDDLSAQSAYAELSTSKQALQAITGKNVKSISFPGGRFNNSTLEQCENAEIELLFGSEFGVLRADFASAVFNRVAIRRNTDLVEFKRIIEQDKQYYRTQIAKYRCKQTLKGLVGNRLYHGLYKHLSRR